MLLLVVSFNFGILIEIMPSFTGYISIIRYYIRATQCIYFASEQCILNRFIGVILSRMIKKKQLMTKQIQKIFQFGSESNQWMFIFSLTSFEVDKTIATLIHSMWNYSIHSQPLSTQRIYLSILLFDHIDGVAAHEIKFFLGLTLISTYYPRRILTSKKCGRSRPIEYLAMSVVNWLTADPNANISTWL